MRAVFFFSAAVLAIAQNGPVQGTLPLTMKHAVEIALTPEGNPRVSIAMETIKQAEMRKLESRAALLPDLEGSVSDHRQTTNLRAFGFTFTIPIAGLSFPSVVGPYSVFEAPTTLNQTVFDFSTIKRYQASKVNIDAAKDDFDATKNQVTDTVARAYLLRLRADAACETAQANVELSEALLKSAQNQKDAGTGTGIEVVRAQVQLANDKQKLVAAQNDQHRAGLNLLKAMGLKLDANVQLTDKLSYKPEEIPPLEATLADARKTRAELKSQQDRESSAKLTYDSVKWERLPSVSANADYGTIGSQLFGAHPTYTYGASVHVPVFDGGRRDARRVESLSQLRQEQTRTRDLEQQVELEVRTAFDSLKAAVTEIETAREGVRLAEQEVAQARRRYEAGVTNSIEVTDAQTRLDRARDNQINALYHSNLARIDLASATGRIREYVNQ